MKKYIIQISTVFLVSLLSMSCEKDTLTEEEVLALDQQDVTYSVLIKDPFTKAPISGVAVKVTINGELKELTTNDGGVVEFKSKVKDVLPLSLSKDGYFPVNFNTQVQSGGNRSAIIPVKLDLFPKASYGTVTITGTIWAQTDLTTAGREPAAGATFSVVGGAYDYQTGQYHELNPIKVVADNAGKYSVAVPAFTSQIYGYNRFVYESYTTKQKIAINREVGQQSFPATLPSVQSIDTNFDPNLSAMSIPGVYPVYATIPAPPAGPNAIQANPFYIGLDGAGGLFVGTSGISSTGGGYAAGDVSLNIVSLVGGTGAVGVIRDTNANGSLDQYQMTTAGTGYPKTTNANVVTTEGFSPTSPFYNNNNLYYYNVSNSWRPGTILVNNIILGTGTSRAVDVQ